jgi:Major Facilitator Superfamily
MMASSTIAMPGNAPIRFAQSAAAGLPSEISKSPLLGILGVIIGAGVVTLTGRMISLGLADLKGGLGFGFDDGSWISSAYNIALMFIGPFTVYIGALLGPRRILLLAATSFTLICLLAPFIHSYSLMIVAMVLAGITSGTFYPLTLTFALRNIPLRFLPYTIDAVCDLCGWSSQYCAITIRLVPGASFMALDILEFRGNYGVHDDLHLLRNSQTSRGKEIKPGSKLCRFSVREYGTGDALRSHRSRRTARLVAFRSFQCFVLRRRVPGGMRHRAPSANP